MAFVAAVSNPEVTDRLERLSKKLKQIAASKAPARPTPERPKRRCGDISAAITQVLAEAEAPMRPIAVHEAVERRLQATVSLGTVKDCMARHARPNGRFVRIARGRYVIAPLS